MCANSDMGMDDVGLVPRHARLLDARDEFRRYGFVLLRGVVGRDIVGPAREAVDAMWRLAKRGKVPQVRVYEDYPTLLGGVNVAAIEDPFANVPALKTALLGARLQEILPALTGWAGADLEVARLHVNDRFRYQGFWHRDARVEDHARSVVAIVYLRDEAGFRIMPEMAPVNRSGTGDRLQAVHAMNTLPGEHEVVARAGDVLVMRSYLLHRGYCTAKRSHLHLRFVPGASFDVRPWLNFRWSGSVYTPSSTERRWKNFARYLWPSWSRSNWWQPAVAEVGR